MKSYVLTTGAVFALIVLAHLLRVLDEGPRAADPSFILTTIAAGALSLWAWRVFRRLPRP